MMKRTDDNSSESSGRDEGAVPPEFLKCSCGVAVNMANLSNISSHENSNNHRKRMLKLAPRADKRAKTGPMDAFMNSHALPRGHRGGPSGGPQATIGIGS
eukprot:GHVU01108611.1.p2 GENE.GHVU01108611.1~~GHVU01108611.1.p2  ORF type:complete len:100 (-),score=9.97 GHVU01108611.1:707-1006(-)